MKVLDTLGFNGPYILFIITFLSIWREYKFFIAFPIGWFFNSQLNKFLKNWIREPRPPSLGSIGNIDNINNYTGIEKFGMPSGHAQSIFFALMYLYLVKKSKTLLLITLFLASLTLYQRWIYGRHTIAQLFFGACVGIAFSYLWYFIVEKLQF